MPSWLLLWKLEESVYARPRKSSRNVLPKLESCQQHPSRQCQGPYHGCIGHVGGRMPLVRSVQGWELDGITDEEDGLYGSAEAVWASREPPYNAVEHPVLVSLLGEDLHAPSADITNGVGAAPFRSNGRDA